MAGNTEKRGRQDSYIEGNTVRMQAVPKRREVTQPVHRPEEPEKSPEELAREKARKSAARRNSRRALALDGPYTVFLAVVTVVCCLFCAAYVNLKADITSQLSEIAELESQISDQKEENAAAEKLLQTSMTLEEIRTRASELGMVYPSSDQVYYYTVENSDYMITY